MIRVRIYAEEWHTFKSVINKSLGYIIIDDNIISLGDRTKYINSFQSKIY